MNETRFHHLESLHWLWLVLAMVALLMIGWSAKRRAMMRFAAQSLWYSLIPNVNWTRQYIRGVLIIAASVMLVAALLDPRWGVHYEEVQRRGIDILFVVDVSRSMLAEDAKPNRLERAKQYISDVVDELGGDRVGLVSFAGIAALKCPLTIDYGAFRLSLNELNTESAARGGSQLGDALRLAGDSFTDEAHDARIVIVLTDGEDQGSYPEEAAQKLVSETAAHIFTVGLGDSNEGARIPLVSRTSKTYLTYRGQEVWSKLNNDLLTKIALAGGGAYVPAGTASFDLGQFYEEKIAPMGTRKIESGRIEIRDPQYQWFAGLALALLLADSWMSDRVQAKKRWLFAGVEVEEESR